MNIRPKTQRRVLILIVIMLVIGGLSTWFYVARMKQLNAQTDQLKVQGMKAYQAGDFKGALDPLSKYVTKRKNDTEALYAFGICRSKVPTLDGTYISESITIFRKYTTMVPTDIEAKHRLLEWESPVSTYAGPAISLAQELLQTNPRDLTALKALATINLHEHHYPEALDAARKYTSQNPTDLDLQQIALVLMQNTGAKPAVIHAYADALAKQYPDDPRFMIVQVFAYFYGHDATTTSAQQTKDDEAAKKLVLAAAQKDPPDSQFVEITVNFLDRLQQFGESQNLLDRAVRKLNDPGLMRSLVQRLWENQKYAEVVTRLANIDPASPGSDVELIAFKALSLYQLSKNTEADALVQALASRNNDPVAYAWSIALKAQFNKSNTDAQARLDQYREALQHDPHNPIVQYMVGEAYLQMGESELGLAALRDATSSVPSWAEPHIRIAQILASTGHGADAEATHEADEAMSSSKTDNGSYQLSAVIAMMQVRFAHAQVSQDTFEIQSLLADVQSIQAKVPGEPNTLPIYASLLARVGERDRAIKVIKDAETQTTGKGEELLLKLAAVSRASNLGLEASLYDAIEHQYGLTPRLALARATEMLNDKHAAEGLTYLTDAKGKGSGDPSLWDRAICTYREAARDPGAAEAWRVLGDANPKDLSVQSTILSGEDSAWANRDFINRTIDRVKALTGEEAVLWKIARARWLLGSDDPQKDAAAAVVLLSDVLKHTEGQFRPHILMASAYEKLAARASDDKERQNDLSNAMNEWRAAADILPNSPQLLFALMRSLRANGKVDEARNVFDKIAALPQLAPDVALQAAVFIAGQGELARAEKLLLAYPNASNQVLYTATLAKLYRREGSNEAATLYFNLSKAKELDAVTIAEAADFFGSQNRPQDARQFLDRLANMQLPAGQRELILADFNERYGDMDVAAKQYAAAVQAAPNNPDVLLEQIGFFIRHQRWTEAQASIDAGVSHWPQDPRLVSDKAMVGTFAAASRNPQTVAVMRELSRDPRNPAALDTLKVLTAAAGIAPSVTLDQLRGLLDKYPNFQPLYSLTVTQMLVLHRVDESVTLAAKAMNQFPDSPDAAQMAAEVYGMVGRWSDSLDAAMKWRQRGVDNPIYADSMIAAAEMFVGQPQAAIDRLQPYIAQAQARPEDFADITMQYCEALIRGGKEADAVALLTPIARKFATFRTRWLQIANSSHNDADSAMAWIDQVRPLLTPDSFDEQQALAIAYYGVGQKFQNVHAYELARDTFKPFVGKPAMNSAGMIRLGMAATNCNDVAYAEQIYRQVLASEPGNIRAENNLADLLRRKFDPSSWKEAETLARAACGAADPADADSSSYYDTLARVLLKQGKSDEAIAAFEQGNKIHPNDLNLLVGLADTHARNNHIDLAEKYLATIDAVLPRDAKLAADLKAELDDARDTVKKALSRSSVTGTD